MMKRIWILGAADPEMAAIERLLTAVGETVGYAMVDGVRVHPGNAYAADTFGPSNQGGSTYGVLVPTLVEVECHLNQQPPVCDGQEGQYWPTMVVDHHRQGDPGFGRPPQEYAQASSLGQVLRTLAAEQGHDDDVSCQAGGRPYPEYIGIKATAAGLSAICDDCGAIMMTVPDGHLIAAADHCLAAAYAGQCPGVDPDALMAWRVRTRGKFQCRTDDEILRDVQTACVLLMDAYPVSPMGEHDGPSPDAAMTCPPVADLRAGYCPKCRAIGDWTLVRQGAMLAQRLPGQQSSTEQMRDCSHPQGFSPIPELPEAAARRGQAYLARVMDKDRRIKVVLGAASPKQVQLFLSHYPASGKYGDPARGFAGGYES